MNACRIAAKLISTTPELLERLETALLASMKRNRPWRPVFLVDMFLDREGQLQRIRRIEATCSAEAISTAMVLVPPMEGSIAFFAVVSEDVVHSASPLASFGAIPADYLTELLLPQCGSV